MKYTTIDSYITDDWQATKRLTLTFGVRFDHLGPWVDSMARASRCGNRKRSNQKTSSTAWTPTIPPLGPDICLAQRKGHHAGLQPSSFRKPQHSDVLLPARRPCVRSVWERPRLLFEEEAGGAYRYHDSYYTSDGPLLTSLGVATYITLPEVLAAAPSLKSATRGIYHGRPAQRLTLGSGSVCEI